jgi:MFS family permease
LPATLSSPRSRLPGAVVALGWVSFCTDASSEMIVPLLPAFVGALGGGPAFLGLLEGFANAVVALLKGASGLWSDRGRRKPFVFAGYGLSSIVRPLMALAGSPAAVLAVRVADRVGKGLRSAPRDALIAQSSAPEERGRAYGLQRAMDHAGAVTGPLFALLLLGLGCTYPTVFALAAVPAAAAMLVLFFAVREPMDRASPAPTTATAPQPRPAGWRPFLAVVALTSLGPALDLQLVFRAEELGIDKKLAPILWVLMHTVRSSLSTPLGGLSDRLGRRRVIAGGLLAQFAVLAAFGIAQTSWLVWLLFALHGLHAAFTEGAERGLVTDYVGKRKSGSAFGLYYLVNGLAVLPLSVGFGEVYTHWGAPLAFTSAAACSLLALGVLLAAVPARARAG